ncbi:MAG: NAD(P)-binding protein [Candidatus Hodarchaeota archaeon]
MNELKFLLKNEVNAKSTDNFIKRLFSGFGRKFINIKPYTKEMEYKVYETVIIGAGMAGLACAKKLQEKGIDFVIISEDIGGRVLTSADGKTTYGAFFVCSDYFHVLKYVKLKSKIRLRDFCFHKENKIYVFFEPRLLKFSFQFLKVLFWLYKFRRALRKFRKASETISQKEAIENDSFLYGLYMQKADDFVKKHKLQTGTEAYLSEALYSTTFSKITEINAFFYLQYLTPLITSVYTFMFEKEKLIRPFKEKIVIGCVDNITFANDKYQVRANSQIFSAKNIVLATQITRSQKFAGIKKINRPVSTHMLHIKGTPKPTIARKPYHLFAPPSDTQAIAKLEDGTYLFYYKNKRPVLDQFFTDYTIIAHRHWDPAGTINGHTLIESNRGNNMYLIGDFNVVGLEDAYITGLYAANQIIGSNKD